jgi:hypothetical protein
LEESIHSGDGNDINAMNIDDDAFEEEHRVRDSTVIR